MKTVRRSIALVALFFSYLAAAENSPLVLNCTSHEKEKFIFSGTWSLRPNGSIEPGTTKINEIKIGEKVWSSGSKIITRGEWIDLSLEITAKGPTHSDPGDCYEKTEVLSTKMKGPKNSAHGENTFEMRSFSLPQLTAKKGQGDCRIPRIAVRPTIREFNCIKK